jgi:hypothetical protein
MWVILIAQQVTGEHAKGYIKGIPGGSSRSEGRARAFGVPNTLDSGFTHLVAAPIVALFFGGIASLLAWLQGCRCRR